MVNPGRPEGAGVEEGAGGGNALGHERDGDHASVIRAERVVQRENRRWNDHGAGTLVARREGVAGPDGGLLGRQRDVYAGRAAAVELALGDGVGTGEHADDRRADDQGARRAWARRSRRRPRTSRTRTG